jgi:hypothetical protein
MAGTGGFSYFSCLNASSKGSKAAKVQKFMTLTQVQNEICDKIHLSKRTMAETGSSGLEMLYFLRIQSIFEYNFWGKLRVRRNVPIKERPWLR